MKQKALFLDRDGTINVEKEYLYKIEDFEFTQGAVEALRAAQKAGYKLIVITNQSGIARGYYTLRDFEKLNHWMLEQLASQGVLIDKVYFCPHLPDAPVPEYRKDCDCRKPRTGLFDLAIREFDLDASACCAVGDKLRDCCISEITDCRGILIGHNEKQEIIDKVKAGAFRNVTYAESLADAVDTLINAAQKE